MIRHNNNDNGFTIIELMIAMTILAILLVVASVVMINISTTYSKGVNSANLQNTARTIAGDVSANLQFSNAAPQTVAPSGSNPASAICIGTTRYTFILNQELGTDPYVSNGSGGFMSVTTNHVLWRDTISGNSTTCTPLVINNPINRATGISPVTSQTIPVVDNSDSNPQDNGYEMMPQHTRIIRFDITPVLGKDIYTVNIWIAYGDSDLLIQDTSNGHYYCRGVTGEQFCATSDLTTAVTGRLY